jgi:hypothetical protein
MHFIWYICVSSNFVLLHLIRCSQDGTNDHKVRSNIIPPTFVIAMWLLCWVAPMILISPIIFIGCCTGVEDWGHLGPVEGDVDVLLFSHDRWCAGMINYERRRSKIYNVLLCVIMTLLSSAMLLLHSMHCHWTRVIFWEYLGILSPLRYFYWSEIGVSS